MLISPMLLGKEKSLCQNLFGSIDRSAQRLPAQELVSHNVKVMNNITFKSRIMKFDILSAKLEEKVSSEDTVKWKVNEKKDFITYYSEFQILINLNLRSLRNLFFRAINTKKLSMRLRTKSILHFIYIHIPGYIEFFMMVMQT